MPVAGGWQLFAHPLFLDQIEKLTAAVERARAKDPRGWPHSANAKLLAALRQLMFTTIPQDPGRAEYRQGGTLGDGRRHWFRAKFGGGRFRLFFRYSSSAKIIIVAGVNDETTLRTYGSKSDAYAVFRRMLDKGDPPDSWAALLAAASEPGARAAGGRLIARRAVSASFNATLGYRASAKAGADLDTPACSGVDGAPYRAKMRTTSSP
jgi:toxin YhaV